MAVVDCHYDRQAFTANFDRRNQGVYRGSWIVETNSTMAPADVITACQPVTSVTNPVPALYATYSYQGDTDTASYAQDFECVPRGSIEWWTINVVWSPLPTGLSSNDLNTNPLSRGVEYQWDWEVYTEIVEEDKEGKPIVNTAGKPFDINVEMERSRGVLLLMYNVATLGAAISVARTYQDAVNSTTWTLGTTSIPPRTALCRNAQTTGLITEPGGSYYRVTLRIAFKEDGETWDESLLSRGFGYLTVPNDKQTYTTEDRNQNQLKDTLDEPLLLNMDGTPVDESQGDTPYYSKFRVRREVNFNALPSN